MVAQLLAVKLGNYGALTLGDKNTSAFLEALDKREETYAERSPRKSCDLFKFVLRWIDANTRFLFASGISLYLKKGYRIKNGCAHSNRGVVVADGR